MIVEEQSGDLQQRTVVSALIRVLLGSFALLSLSVLCGAIKRQQPVL